MKVCAYHFLKIRFALIPDCFAVNIQNDEKSESSLHLLMKVRVTYSATLNVILEVLLTNVFMTGVD